MTEAPTEAQFVHLRVHTAFSLSEGAIRIGDLVDLCRKADLPAVAVTDSANLFGALEFATTAAKAGIQPIIGCLLPIAGGVGNGRQNGAGLIEDRFAVLVQDEIGYQNLMALISRAYLEADPAEAPRLTLDDLDGHTSGLIALTGSLDSAVGRLLKNGQRDHARDMLARLAPMFEGRLYIELQRHGLDDEARIEPVAIELAYEIGLPLVATNDVYFADESYYEAHDALLCVAEGAYIAETDRRRVTVEHRFKTGPEMVELFADLPEAIANTGVIARRCSYMPTPRDPILPPFQTVDELTEGAQLMDDARNGLKQRCAQIGIDPEGEEAKPYWERLEFELQVIDKMDYAGYFLIVADFIQWAKTNGIPVGPGRGSGAGSVVAWALTITDLDPLRWGLLFERFLNPERVSMPDFDIDFCQERRDEVIQYVQSKYGPDHVAQIITFGKLQARAVIRDVGRVLEMPYGQVDRISKLVPNNPANPMTLTEAIAAEPQLAQMRDEDETVANLLRLALKLEGLYRNASTHAAGVVIGDRPLQELVPLYRDPRSDVPTTQFNMKDVEKAGLVKFDFLGLKTLSILQRTVDLLKARGIEIDLSEIPLDDEATFAMMSKGETTGVFQFESPGMRSLLREAGVDNFSDIIALVALFRPGPMENIPKYVACKHGREKPEFLHESIVPVTADTYGVIIYQEQVMQIAQVFAGFDLGQADLLRRAMGKKIKAEMDAQRGNFVEGAVARGVEEGQARYVFDLVDKFAGYGFNKAHSAGYALVAYQTAYFKTHYPVEFFAATMTFDMNNTDKLSILRQELSGLGIELLPPDINRSAPEFSVEAVSDGLAVRYALGAIKGVGRQAMESVVNQRGQAGPFEDLTDFAGRIDPHLINKRQLEQLITAGAFDGLHANRAQLRGGIDIVLAHAHGQAQDRISGQTNLFGGSDGNDAPAIVLPPSPEWPPAAKLAKEYEALGFYLSAHPLDEYQNELERLGVVRSTGLEEVIRASGGSALVKIAGAVLGLQVRISQRRSRYAFVQLSDPGGVIEGTLFAEVLTHAQDLLESGRPVLVQGTARLEDEQIKLNILSVESVDEAISQAGASLRVWVNDASPLEPLRHLIETEAIPSQNRRSRNGKGGISLVIPVDDREVEVALAGSYLCTPQIRAAVKAIPGVVEVTII
ncbi:MAG: DNA polymerase III subunit alpha [Alphaproteobacteria bacterium]|nr:DNA polymerase III subunit alpha [Alphaproteobacteria bacterium]